MRLEARDKRALILGAIAVVALLAYLLWPRGTDGSSVELVAADQRQGAPAPAAVPPPQVQAAPVALPAAPPVPPAGALPEGLTLTGVAGTGAIFSFPDGAQRFVGRGRQVAPGVILQAVRLRDVILAAGAINYRLPLGGVAVPIQPPSVVPAAPATVPAPSVQPAPALPVVAVPAPPAPASQQPALDRNSFK